MNRVVTRYFVEFLPFVAFVLTFSFNVPNAAVFFWALVENRRRFASLFLETG